LILNSEFKIQVLTNFKLAQSFACTRLITQSTEASMTRDGIIKDVSETKRVLMSGDFTPKQSDTLIGFVNEQIKDYCHSKVDQRIFERKLDEKLDALKTIFHSKEDQQLFEEKFKHFEQKTEERFLQMLDLIKNQSLAINELSKKMDKINEKNSLS